jgi:hypothetical protein
MTDEPGPMTPERSGPGSKSFSGPTNRGALVVGGVLILVGLLFLAERLFEFDLGTYGWPLFVIVPGVLLLFAGLAAPVREGVGLAIAGTITTTTGLVLAFQNATDSWSTWAYAWALVGPASAGLGMAFYGLVRGVPGVASEGLRVLGVGLALFVGFGLFFEGVIGLSGEPFLIGSDYLPFALIAAGLVVLVWGMIRGRRG